MFFILDVPQFAYEDGIMMDVYSESDEEDEGIDYEEDADDVIMNNN